MLFRIIILLCLILIFNTLKTSAQLTDSISSSKHNISITYNTSPSVYQGMYRYNVKFDFTEDYRIHNINFKIYDLIEQQNLTHHSFTTKSLLLRNIINQDNELKNISDKELYYAIWRAKLVNIKQDSEIKDIMNYGVDFLIANGYNSLTEDIFPFLSILLDEHSLYHYDKSRIEAFGAGSTGKYTITELFENFKITDKSNSIGVCRDIHDAGLRMLREICNNYYSIFYPDKKINIDDFLFLTSWTTQNSQHITISLIDPIKQNKTYEFDWGRFIEKENNVGYEHGRNYGNVYRIWKYNKNKDITQPIDFKKTQVGNIFDDKLYNSNEIDCFTGIRDIEPYSALNWNKIYKKGIEVNLSSGVLVQEQKFVMGSFLHRSKELKLFKILKYKGVTSVQAMFMDETNKKNLLFPRYEYEYTRVLYGFPRYLAGFETKNINFDKNLTSYFYLYNSLEVFLFIDYFKSDNPTDYKKIHKSGDGGIYLTPGYAISYNNSDKTIKTEIKIQTRCFLIPKDVRLMTANPFALVKNSTIVSSAKDLILDFRYIVTNAISLNFKSILEYTNQNNILTSSVLNNNFRIKTFGCIFTEIGMTRNLKGYKYFWYPVDKNWLQIGYTSPNQVIKIGAIAQYFDNKEFTFGLQLSCLL